MIKFYVTQIKLQKITIDDVPSKLKKKVKEALEEDKKDESN